MHRNIFSLLSEMSIPFQERYKENEDKKKPLTDDQLTKLFIGNMYKNMMEEKTRNGMKNEGNYLERP